MRKWVFPGSFDPITLGHQDIIRRAAGLCDELIVAVLHNPVKQGLFTFEQRMDMIRRVTEGVSNLKVYQFEGLLADYALMVGAQAIVRGLRTGEDSPGEIQMAQLNRMLAPGVETVLMLTAPQYAFISSSFVREIAAKGGHIQCLVPAAIVQDVYRACQTTPNSQKARPRTL